MEEHAQIARSICGQATRQEQSGALGQFVLGDGAEEAPEKIFRANLPDSLDFGVFDLTGCAVSDSELKSFAQQAPRLLGAGGDGSELLDLLKELRAEFIFLEPDLFQPGAAVRSSCSGVMRLTGSVWHRNIDGHQCSPHSAMGRTLGTQRRAPRSISTSNLFLRVSAVR